MGDMLSYCKKNIFHNDKLREVNLLDKDKSNDMIFMEQILREHQGYVGNKQAMYVPYNNVYEDRGWGCAWRAIQMVISAYKINDSFIDLFHKYSQKGFLLQLAKRTKQYDQKILKTLQQSQFAPEEAASNWAEPFICKLVCQDRNIKSRLFLLNGYPSANAPKDVFLETKNFGQFVSIVKQSIRHSPVMIDDGRLALTILAYKQLPENCHGFILGDPHINSNKIDQNAGIYEIVCDSNGKLIRNFVSKETYKFAYTDTLKNTDFNSKNWMVLATEGWKNDYLK